MDRPRILIIDDDFGLRKTLADILKAKDYDVFVAGNGAEGLALLEKHTVALVLIDLGLPDMAGLDVLDRVKATHPFIEAIILTGNATLDSAIEATNRGAFSYLLKPYEINPLLLQIRRAIEKGQARKRIAQDSIELQKMNTELKALYNVSLAISRAIDLEEMLSEVLHALVETEIFTFEIKGAVFLIERGELRLASFISLSAAEMEPCGEIRVGECFCGRAMETGEIVVVKNCSGNTCHPMRPPLTHPHGHILVPLKMADTVLGLLNLYIHPETEVNAEMVKLLSTVASQMGIAINNTRRYEETKSSALHDPLTGLANRRFLEMQLDKNLESAKRYQEALSVVMLDIDHFKNYNDTYGHVEGDRLLVRLADILLREVRKADYIFRYGGEEFLVLLPETGPDRARETAERLRRAVEAKAGGVTISLGIASLSESLQEKDRLIDVADNALYRAKKNGRNRVETGEETVGLKAAPPGFADNQGETPP